MSLRRSSVLVRFALTALALALAVTIFLPGDPDPAAGPAAPGSRAGMEGAAAESGPLDAAEVLDQAAPGDAADRRTRVELAPAEAARPPDEDAVYLVGRLVDDRRLPVADAVVTAHRLGRAPLSATADGAGGFRLGPFPRPEADGEEWWLLGALDEAAGWERGWIAGRAPSSRSYRPPPPLRAEVEVPPIVLGPAAAVRVAVESGGGPAAGATVSARAEAEGVLVGQARAGADGRVVFPALPLGPFHLEARAGDLLARHTGVLELAGADVLLPLAPSRTVEVLVVDAADGSPVAGAELSLHARLIPSPTSGIRMGYRRIPSSHLLPVECPPTDAQGRSILRGLPDDGYLSLRVSAAGFGGRSGPLYLDSVTAKIPAGAARVQVELSRIGRRTVTWPVTVREVEAPPEGTELELVERAGAMGGPAGPGRGWIRGGRVVVEGVPSLGFDRLAIAPDRTRAWLWVDGEALEGREVWFWRPRTLRVRLLDQAGEPALGWRVDLRNQGNNHEARSQPVGADGMILVEDLPQQMIEVRAVPPEGGPGTDLSLGTADLRREDGLLEATVPSLAELQVEVLLDGAPGLPGRYSLSVAGNGSEVLAEDPARGSLRARAWLDPEAAQTSLLLRAEGYQGGKAELETARLLEGAPARLELTSTASLVCSVLQEQNTRVELRPQRYSDQEGRWETLPMRELSSPNLPDGRYSFEGLSAGRYRARDALSGLASAEAEVRPLGAAAEVVLDLLSLRTVSGRLELPEGYSRDGCLILIQGRDLDFSSYRRHFLSGFPEAGFNPQRDGSFRFRLPSDRGVVLRPWHPVLSPAPPADGGEAVLADGTEGLVLRLVEGPVTVVPLAPELAEVAGYGSLPVRLFRGPPTGEGVYLARAPVADGRLRFGGYPPGRYTVWIDPEREYAPVIYPDVELGGGETLLPAAAAHEGAKIRVRLKVAGPAALAVGVGVEVDVIAEALVEAAPAGRGGAALGLAEGGEPGFAQGVGLAQQLLELVEVLLGAEAGLQPPLLRQGTGGGAVLLVEDPGSVGQSLLDVLGRVAIEGLLLEAAGDRLGQAGQGEGLAQHQVDRPQPRAVGVLGQAGEPRPQVGGRRFEAVLLDQLRDLTGQGVLLEAAPAVDLLVGGHRHRGAHRLAAEPQGGLDQLDATLGAQDDDGAVRGGGQFARQALERGGGVLEGLAVTRSRVADLGTQQADAPLEAVLDRRGEALETGEGGGRVVTERVAVDRDQQVAGAEAAAVGVVAGLEPREQHPGEGAGGERLLGLGQGHAGDLGAAPFGRRAGSLRFLRTRGGGQGDEDGEQHGLPILGPVGAGNRRLARFRRQDGAPVLVVEDQQEGRQEVAANGPVGRPAGERSAAGGGEGGPRALEAVPGELEPGQPAAAQVHRAGGAGDLLRAGAAVIEQVEPAHRG